MINVEPCRGCGRPLIIHPVANLTVRLETEPLDASATVDYLLQGGRSLWMVDTNRQTVRRAQPGEPGPLREHRCTKRGTEKLATAAQTASQEVTPPRGPANPPARPQSDSHRFSGRPTGKPAEAVEPRRFEIDWTRVGAGRSHPCDACLKPVVIDGPAEYVSIELGATVVWAQHANCTEATGI